MQGFLTTEKDEWPTVLSTRSSKHLVKGARLTRMTSNDVTLAYPSPTKKCYVVSSKERFLTPLFLLLPQKDMIFAGPCRKVEVVIQALDQLIMILSEGNDQENMSMCKNSGYTK